MKEAERSVMGVTYTAYSYAQRMSPKREFPAAHRDSIPIFENQDEFRMKNRKKQRANRKLKPKEELLDRYNAYGVKDLTVYNAVRQIMTGGKAAIVLK